MTTHLIDLSIIVGGGYTCQSCVDDLQRNFSLSRVTCIDAELDPQYKRSVRCAAVVERRLIMIDCLDGLTLEASVIQSYMDEKHYDATVFFTSYEPGCCLEVLCNKELEEMLKMYPHHRFISIDCRFRVTDRRIVYVEMTKEELYELLRKQ